MKYKLFYFHAAHTDSFCLPTLDAHDLHFQINSGAVVNYLIIEEDLAIVLKLKFPKLQLYAHETV